MDTGVRMTHSEFYTSKTNKKPRVKCGFSLDRRHACDDVVGHGTQVASLAAGLTYGIAKRANVVAVKISDDSGEIYGWKVLAGFNYVYTDTQETREPSVVNMSFSFDAVQRPLNDAVKAVCDSSA